MLIVFLLYCLGFWVLLIIRLRRPSVERLAEKCVDEDHVDVSVQWTFNHLLLLLLILLKIFHKIATDKVNDI